MTENYKYDHYKTVPDPAEKVNYKKKKPKLIAVVDEDNCTGYMDGHVELKLATSTVPSRGGTANI